MSVSFSFVVVFSFLFSLVAFPAFLTLGFVLFAVASISASASISISIARLLELELELELTHQYCPLRQDSHSAICPSHCAAALARYSPHDRPPPASQHEQAQHRARPANPPPPSPRIEQHHLGRTLDFLPYLRDARIDGMSTVGRCSHAHIQGVDGGGVGCERGGAGVEEDSEVGLERCGSGGLVCERCEGGGDGGGEGAEVCERGGELGMAKGEAGGELVEMSGGGRCVGAEDLETLAERAE